MLHKKQKRQIKTKKKQTGDNHNTEYSIQYNKKQYDR